MTTTTINPDEISEKSARAIQSENKVRSALDTFVEAVDKAASMRKRDLMSASGRHDKVEKAIARAESVGGSVTEAMPEFQQTTERLRTLWAIHGVRNK